MHTRTLLNEGVPNESSSVALPNDQALPVHVKRKEAVAGTRAARRATRKDSDPAAADSKADDAGPAVKGKQTGLTDGSSSARERLVPSSSRR
jgi:hypothetical protein